MCEPHHYCIPYILPKLRDNRWMDHQVQPESGLSLTQFLALKRSFQNYDIEILNIPPQPGLFDMCFTANAGFFINGYFMPSRFLHEHRQPETKFYRKYFAVLEIKDKNAIFEGQGDAFRLDSKTVLITQGSRTNEAGLRAVERLIKEKIDPGIKIVSVRLRTRKNSMNHEKVFYHGDTCIFYSSSKKIFIVYPRAFLYWEESLKTLSDHRTVYIVDKEDALKFICNSVEIDERTVLTPIIREAAFPKPHFPMRELLKFIGYQNIVEHDISQFLLSGGGPRCLSLDIQKCPAT